MTDSVASNSEAPYGRRGQESGNGSLNMDDNRHAANDGQRQGPNNNRVQVQPLNNVNNNNVQQQLNNQFGTIRDRIFQAMLVRVAVCYHQYVPKFVRRLIEFFTLLIALLLLCLMLYVHFSFGRRDADCLSSLADVWPRDGVLRVEVINNWDKYNAFQERLAEALRSEKASSNSTFFDLKEILMKGPKALPRELRKRSAGPTRETSDHWSNLLLTNQTVFDFLWRPGKVPKDRLSKDDILHNPSQVLDEERLLYSEAGPEATYECVIEYSLHNGLLRLSDTYRMEHNIPFMRVRIDPDTDACFGDAFNRFLMRHFLGFEDVLMSSVKSLAGNEIEKGISFLKDLMSGELYRFVPSGHSRLSYLYAFFVMLIFTFAISMLLRFSHYQIFIFIVDLLQIFDQNSIMAFPAAPLLTVIMALFGMETIMREIFNDTSTGFYVILLVWVADQFDSICCHAPISKRHWLRFFYLYHFAFYAYHYRFNGQYGGLALLTSTFFIMHSMIYFFHHYEMPLILYRERIQRIIENIQDEPESPQGAGMGETIDTAPQPPLIAGNNEDPLSAESESAEVISPAPASATDLIDTENLSDLSLRGEQPLSENLEDYDNHDDSPNLGNITEISLPSMIPGESYSNDTNGVLTGGAEYAIRNSSGDLTEQLLAAERTARELVANAMNGLF